LKLSFCFSKVETAYRMMLWTWYAVWMSRWPQLSNWALPPSSCWCMFCPSCQIQASVTSAHSYAQCQQVSRANLGHMCVDFWFFPGLVLSLIDFKQFHAASIWLTVSWCEISGFHSDEDSGWGLFWVVVPCSVAAAYRCLGGPCSLCLHCNTTWCHNPDNLKLITSCFCNLFI